tara:strand:- start:69867 stop:72935 length:3069 start_codon:yes stop_codon:yes gene_type:complete
MISSDTVPLLSEEPSDVKFSQRDQIEDSDPPSAVAGMAQETDRGTTNLNAQRHVDHQQPTVESRKVLSSTEPNLVRQLTVDESATTSKWVWVRSWGAVVYAIVACAILLRLLASLIVIQRVRRRGIEIGVAHNGIRILEAEVAVPLAIGFGRPAIVLPQGFREAVKPDELQDVLDHEAEHLLRGDHWIMLLQGITAAAYWPIFTVHLLNLALSRAREELCDNAVLTNRDSAAYGQTLLTVGEQVSSRRAFVAQLASSMIRRGELERRVAGVLDTQRDRRTRMSRRVRWMVATSLMGIVILAGTTRVVAVADQPTAVESNVVKPKVVVWPLRQVDPEQATLHRGIVLGPDGKPLAGAAIYAATSIQLQDRVQVGAGELGPKRAVTDAKGRFEFHAVDLTWVLTAGKRKWWEILLVATKEGVASGWLKTRGVARNLRSHKHPPKIDEVILRTRPPETLTGQFLLEGGTPLVGARVQLTTLMAPIKYDLDVHVPREEENVIGKFQSYSIDYAETLNRPSVLPDLRTEATTDKNGRFELQGLPEGFIARIEVTHSQAVTTSLRVAVRSIASVYRKSYSEQGEPTLSLYGSGFTVELARGIVLRGQVTSSRLPNRKAAAGVIVALANHNARGGIYGQRFQTDVNGRFEMTGLPNRPEGYELAFIGSFAAPYFDHRQRVVPGEDARVILTPAVPYRLRLIDPKGNPVDRDVYSIKVQSIPGLSHTGVKGRFNDAQRVAPGIYEGIVPWGPAAVLVKRSLKTDRPAAVVPKAFFAPGRTDWTLEEERYAYGDAWRIAQPAIVATKRISVGKNRTIDQIDLAAIKFTNAREYARVQELTATVYSDPPVEVTLVDSDNHPVEGARIKRQLKRALQLKQYNDNDLPGTFSVYGLHPDRAEFLVFTDQERGLIGTLSTKWTSDPVSVVMQPAATLIGRFIDDSGEPNFDFGIRMLGKALAPDTFVAGRVSNTTDEPGKRKGEFYLMVPPGVEVRGEFVRKTSHHATRPTVGTAFAPLIPKPGETVDLGDLIVP